MSFLSYLLQYLRDYFTKTLFNYFTPDPISYKQIIFTLLRLVYVTKTLFENEHVFSNNSLVVCLFFEFTRLLIIFKPSFLLHFPHRTSYRSIFEIQFQNQKKLASQSLTQNRGNIYPIHFPALLEKF